jgi:hypothetical protein
MHKGRAWVLGKLYKLPKKIAGPGFLVPRSKFFNHLTQISTPVNIWENLTFPRISCILFIDRTKTIALRDEVERRPQHNTTKQRPFFSLVL